MQALMIERTWNGKCVAWTRFIQKKSILLTSPIPIYINIHLWYTFTFLVSLFENEKRSRYFDTQCSWIKHYCTSFFKKTLYLLPLSLAILHKNGQSTTFGHGTKEWASMVSDPYPINLSKARVCAAGTYYSSSARMCTDTFTFLCTPRHRS